MEAEDDEVVFERPTIDDSRQERSQNACGKLMITSILSASYFGMVC